MKETIKEIEDIIKDSELQITDFSRPSAHNSCELISLVQKLIKKIKQKE